VEKELIPDSVTCEQELTFRDDTHPTLALTLYWHHSTPAATPLIIWFHAGGWSMGNRSSCEPALHLLKHGFAVASADYRKSHQAVFPCQIEDSKAAVRWLRGMAEHFNIDPARIGVWGESSGGHLASMLGTTIHVTNWDKSGPFTNLSSRVKAVCAWYGPTDFYRMNDRPGAIDHDAADSFESKFLGAPIRQVPDKVHEANPISHITKDCPPFLLMHGSDDEHVIPEQSKILHGALRAHGIESRLILLPGCGHGFAKKISQEIFEPVQRFFTGNL